MNSPLILHIEDEVINVHWLSNQVYAPGGGGGEGVHPGIHVRVLPHSPQPSVSVAGVEGCEAVGKVPLSHILQGVGEWRERGVGGVGGVEERGVGEWRERGVGGGWRRELTWASLLASMGRWP